MFVTFTSEGRCVFGHSTLPFLRRWSWLANTSHGSISPDTESLRAFCSLLTGQSSCMAGLDHRSSHCGVFRSRNNSIYCGPSWRGLGALRLSRRAVFSLSFPSLLLQLWGTCQIVLTHHYGRTALC